jgi:hypothetical protein
MKKLINEQFKRMQLLAGLITESQLNEETLNEEGMTLPIPNFLKMGEPEFKVNFTKFTNNSAGNKGFGGTRNDGSFPVSVETDVQGKGPGGKFTINAYVTKEGNLDQIFLPGYDNSEVLVKYVKDWGALRTYITSELAKTPAAAKAPATTSESTDIEKSVNEALRKYRRNKKSSINEAEEAEENPIEVAFQSSSKMVPWNVIEKTYTESGLTGEEFFADVEDEFRSKFENKPVSRDEYYEFYTGLPTAYGQDNMYTMVNWINFTNPKLADELYDMI